MADPAGRRRRGGRGGGLSVHTHRPGPGRSAVCRQAAGWAVTAALLVASLAAMRAGVRRTYPFPYAGTVSAAAVAAGVEPLLALAVMRTESGFRPEARSARGAMGLMQMTPATAAWAAAERGQPASAAGALLDPAYNIRAGIWYLGILWRRFPGRPAAAVAAYNAGPGPVVQWVQGGRWPGTLRTVDDVPFPETRVFVQRVFGALAVYRRLYPHAGRPRFDAARAAST